MAQILDLGKLRFNWKGAYSSSVEYTYNDLVKYGPNLYAFIATLGATNVAPPTDSAKWAIVSEGLSWKGTYTQGTLYYENDVVTDGTSTYIVTVEHTSPTPAGLLPNANTELLALGQPGLPNQASNANKVLTTNGVSASWTATTKLSKTYTGSAQGAGAENFETSAGLTDTMSIFSGSTSDFAQFSIVNLSNGSNASTDFIAYAADGDNDSGWIDMGITSNNFDAETYGITGPHDGYVFMSGARGPQFDIISRRTTAGVATLTTGGIHGFSTGDQVRIIGVDGGYDGFVEITATPSNISFSYAVTRATELETAVDPVGTVWQPLGDGNLVLATSENGKANKIIFAAGGLTAGATQMEITPNQNVHIEIATESTSATTGALTVVGGVGVQGNLNVAGDLDVNGTVDFSGVTLLPIGESANSFAAELTNPVVVVTADLDDYAQIAFQNKSNDANASTDFIAYQNNGDDDNGWIDMGITSSDFDDPDFTITGPGDGYIFVSGLPGGTSRGNLVLATDATGTQNKIIFAAGGLDSDATQMEITPGVNVHIEIPTASTSPTTGALTVVGGVGIQGDVNIQGSITFGGEGTQVGTANLAVEAPFIFTGDGSTSQTNDLGIVTEGKYVIPGLLPTRTIVNKSLVADVATLTTSVNHPYLQGDVVTVTGVDGTFNGEYAITAVTSNTFSYDKVASPVSSTRVGDVTFSINNKVLTSEVATLTTTVTHTFLEGDTVVITGVDATFNGTYTITAVTSNTFSYAKLGSPNVGTAAVSPVGTAVVNRSTATAEILAPVRTRYNAWSKDATDGVWKLASNIVTEPTTTIDYTQEGIVFDGIRVGSIQGSSLLLSSTITGGAGSNIAINTNQFTVNASNGNTGIAGTLSVTGTSTFTGAATFNGGINVTGAASLAELRETVGNVVLSSNVGTFDWTAANVYYVETAPTANMTFNFTNVPTDNNYMLTTNVFVTQGATGRIPTSLTINGAGATIRWANGLTPTGTNGAGKIDVFSFTFHRTNTGSWIVYATANQNF